MFFTDYELPEGESIQEPARVEMPHAAHIETTMRYSRYGKLSLVNSGHFGGGFRICQWCGSSEPILLAAVGVRPGASRKHKNPRSGKECSGPMQSRDLGHSFITDVLEIRFRGSGVPLTIPSLWNSLLYALLEGASEVLGIPRDNLDGTVYHHRRGEAPALVLVDNVPGGAGHVQRVANYLPQVATTARDRLARCSCGPETSCYECLRSYQNQWCHDELQRGDALDFLLALVGSPQ
jgi:hypothetical protein